MRKTKINKISGTVLPEVIGLWLSGDIDADNAEDAEIAIQKVVGDRKDLPVIIDAAGLNYISSAGLRVLLRLIQSHPSVRMIGVNTGIYEILDLTGFTQMMEVERAYREVSIEGLEEIGRGANGVIYRIDRENVVKVYREGTSLEEIRREKEIALKALLLGIPTAISYEVVKVGNRYGSVFEWLDAVSFASILVSQPERTDWCVTEFVRLLESIHHKTVSRGELPDYKKRALEWVDFLRDHLPERSAEKLHQLIDNVPDMLNLVSGEYHTKNVQLVGDDVMLIDMDTLSTGHPIFDLAAMYNAFVGFGEYDPEKISSYQGYDYQTGVSFFRKVLAAYLGTEDEERLRSVTNKARILGYARMIRRAIRRNELETEAGRTEIDLWRSRLIELLEQEDTLMFTCSRMEIEATRENLQQVLSFAETLLDEWNCRPRTRMQVCVAIEESFINIADYAYAPEKGLVEVCMDVIDGTLVIRFTDSGKPFDPLAQEDPDIKADIVNRPVGGLGIFMTKQMMDSMEYAYQDGKNILTLKKKIE